MSSRIWTISLFLVAASLLLSVGVRHFSLKRIGQQRKQLFETLEQEGVEKPQLFRVTDTVGRQGWQLTSTGEINEPSRSRAICRLLCRLSTPTDFIEIRDPSSSLWINTTLISAHIEDYLPE